MDFFAAMDIGGSNARLLLLDEKHNTIGEYEGPGATINVVGVEKFSDIITPFVATALEKNNLCAQNCQGICIAASGVDQKSMETACKEVFEKMQFASDKILVTNDCKVYLFQEQGPAAILTVGTGSIGFGRTKNGEFLRCGGWGQLLSDEGSGFYIGLRILQAMGNYLDGRCEAAILWDLFQEELPSLTDTLKINDYAVDNITNKPAIAKLAILLEKAALQGDPTAEKIFLECVDAQFNIIADLFKKMHVQSQDEKITVLFWGSILTKSKMIRKSLHEKVEKELPAIVEYPKETALQIAMKVAINLGNE